MAKRLTKKDKTPTLGDIANMTSDQKNAFADRLTEQLLAAEKNVEKKPTDIIKIDLKDTTKYKTLFTLFDESEYTVREYLVHEDVSAQFGAQLDGLVRLDELYKLDLMIASGDIPESEMSKLTKDILYSPGNVQGKISSYMKKRDIANVISVDAECLQDVPSEEVK